jgi:hypothetical protein
VGGQVDRDANVADPGRERPGAATRDRVDGGQHAGTQEASQLQDRGVVALDVADLDRHAGGAGRGHDLEGLVGRRGEGLLHEHGEAAADGGQGEGCRRRGDHDRVDLRLRDHGSRFGEGLRAGLGHGVGQGVRIGIGDRGEAALWMGGDHAEVVSTHRAQAGHADPERGRHQRAAGAAAEATGVAISRIAATIAARSSPESIGWTGIASTSSESRLVTGRSRSAAPGT